MSEANAQTILIADDSPEDLRVLAEALRSRGHSVRIVANGSQALESAEALPPDLILLDTHMPEMDGYEACRRLKASDRLKSVPVLFLGAMAETHDKVRALECGGIDYITKPFHAEEVLTKVETHLKLVEYERQLEQGAKAGEEKYRTLVENTKDIVYSADADGRLTFLSARAACYGIDPEEAVSRDVLELIAPEDRERVASDLQVRMTAGEEFPVELRIVGADGHRHWFEEQGTALRDASGEVIGIAGSLRDITDRKRREETLETSEEKFSKAFHTSPDAIVITRLRDGLLVDANEGAERILGYTRAEALGKTTYHLAIWANPKERAAFADALKRNGRADGMEVTLRNKAGQKRTCIITAETIEVAGELCTVTTASDITERKQVEEELRSLTTRYEAILASVPDIIMEFDENKACTWANESGKQFFGDDAIGRDADYYFGGEQETYRRIQQLFGGSEDTIHVESWQRRRDGEERLLAWRCKALKDPKGIVKGGLSTARDVTERVRAQEALRASEEKHRRLFEDSRDAVMMLSSDHRFLDCNDAASVLFGLKTKEDSQGKHPSDLSPPTQPDGTDSHTAAEERMAVALAKGSNFFGWTYRRLDGTDFPAEVLLSTMELEGGAVMQAVVRDITERKEAERELEEHREHLEELVRKRTAELEVANQDLRDREEMFSKITSSAQSAIIMVDNDARISFWNEAAERIFGWTAAEAKGRDCHELLAPTHYHDAYKRAFPRFQEMGQGKLVGKTVEVTAVRRSGEEFPIEISMSAVKLEGKWNAVGIANDISRRKQAEEAMRRHQFIVDSVADMMSVMGRDGTYEAVNASWCEAMGREPDEATGKSVADIWGEEVFASSVAQHLDRVFEGATVSYEAELEFPTKGTRYCEVTFYPYRGSQDQVTHAVVVTRDITIRREAEEQLRKISRAVENSPAAVIITDRDGTIEYVNPAFTEVTGYTPEEAMGQNPRILKSGELPDSLYKELWKTISGGEVWSGEFLNRRRSGQLFWGQNSIAPIFGEGKEITHYVGVQVDVTDEKQVAEDLEAAKQSAESANRAKSAFLANMSHEIRTPMNAILGFSQLMQRDPELTATQREHLGTINRSGEHLLALINDILEMSKIEAGRAELNTTALDLYAMLDDLEMMFRVRTDGKGLRFVALRAPDVPRFIIADESKLRQVLINLLGNAVKFTEEGAITLRVRRSKQAPRDMQDVEARAPGALPEDSRPQPHPVDAVQLLLEVQDTGIGIAEDEIGKLFHAFEQTASGVQSQQGTGLGLAISWQYVRLMGGEITVDSTPGRGTVFRFTIRVTRTDELGEEAARPSGRVTGLLPGQKERRILVADDRDENRALLRGMLEPVGFVVREAADGEEALATVREWAPHLVLMDMKMPVMDGYEAIRRIRSDPKLRDTAIVAVTASAFVEDRRAILETGADDFLSKPFRDHDLFARIRARLDVEYSYAEPEALEGSLADTRQMLALTPDPLGKLPPELVDQMRDATVSADLDRLNQLIDEAEQHDVAITQSLRDLAAAFDYEGLGNLFDRKDPQP